MRCSTYLCPVGFLFLFSVSIAIHDRAHALQAVTDHPRKSAGRLSGQVLLVTGESPHLLRFGCLLWGRIRSF